MSDLIGAFNERLQEIDAYLDLLGAVEQQVQNGPRSPQIGATTITVQQQRILYASVYLQLYNLVESTVTNCLDAFSTAINGTWLPSDLSADLRREWVRCIARTHTELNYDNRLEAALSLCNHLVQTLPVLAFNVEKGGGGNWDDNAIQDITRRLGLNLKISTEVFSNIKQPFRNGMGPLVFIRSLRNDLAHGSISFAECGEGMTVTDLRDLKERTAAYLKEVVDFFKASIDAHDFLRSEHRPKREPK